MLGAYGAAFATRGIGKEHAVAETLLVFQTPVRAGNGLSYEAHACGADVGDGTWEGWIEFIPLDGGEPVRTPRETTQPNRADTMYWAGGLMPVYLEGALRRALAGPVRVTVVVSPTPMFNGPAPAFRHTTVVGDTQLASVLNPFSLYEKDESRLRRQLAALSGWHLINIILTYDLSDKPLDTLKKLSKAALVAIILDGVTEYASMRKRAPSTTTKP